MNTRLKRSKGYGHSLDFVIKQIQRTSPDFLESLTRDLDGCRKAQHLDQVAAQVEALAAQVKTVEAVRDFELADEEVPPPAFLLPRLQNFLSAAAPKVVSVTHLLRDLQLAADDLRKWFAEESDTRLIDMLGCLAKLREALPAVRTSNPHAQLVRRRASTHTEVTRKSSLEEQPAAKRSARRAMTSAGPRRPMSFLGEGDGPAEHVEPSDMQPTPSASSSAEAPSTQQQEQTPIEIGEAVAASTVEELVSNTVADSEISEIIEVAEPDNNCQDALKDLEDALAFMQLSPSSPVKKHRGPARLYVLEEEDFETPLASLESVLAQLTQRDLSTQETASSIDGEYIGTAASETAPSEMDTSRMSDFAYELSSLGDPEDTNPEVDIYDGPLAELEAVLASLKPKLQPSTSHAAHGKEPHGGARVQRLRPAPGAEQAMAAFEAPLADLEALMIGMGSGPMQPAG
jgi:hypothetical protein